MQALTHELESLARRQSELEEVELEAMERVEAADASVAALEAERAPLDAQLQEAKAAQAAATADLDAEIARRALTLGREVDELRENGLTGTPAEVVDRLGAWREKAGVTRMYLQLMDLADLDQVELVAADVAPQLA